MPVPSAVTVSRPRARRAIARHLVPALILFGAVGAVPPIPAQAAGAARPAAAAPAARATCPPRWPYVVLTCVA